MFTLKICACAIKLIFAECHAEWNNPIRWAHLAMGYHIEKQKIKNSKYE